MSDPLVCVSLDGCTVKEVIDEAARANLGNADLVEVRFDRLYLVRPKPEEVEGEDGEIRKIMPPEDEWSKLAVADVNTAEVIEELKGGIPLPVIFTCRPVSEGGFFPGDEDERCGILDAAINSGVSYVDLELSKCGRRTCRA